MNQELLDDLNDLDDLDNDNELDQENSQQRLDNAPVAGSLYVKPLAVSQLSTDPRFLNHMTRVDSLINLKLEKSSLNVSEQEYHLIVRSNEYASQLENEIGGIAKFIKDIYFKRVPELESIVTNSVDFAKCVIEIETKSQAKPQFPFLSPHQAISLQISLAATHPRLPPSDEERVIHSSQLILALNQHHNVLMMYIESCMHMVAPNLCRLVGSTIASKLISKVGGIDKLASTPACNIQVLGSQKTPSLGLGLLQRNHTGYFSQMEIYKKAPKEYQMQLVRMLATNVAKCARIDYLRTCPSGAQGDKIREQVLQRFQKIQEAGPAAYDKALPIPGEQPKKKRGGKRHRKMKELTGITEMQKLRNRMKFNEADGDFGQDDDMGMLRDTGKLRVTIKKQQKLKPSKKIQQVLTKSAQSGMESSLAFGAHQGLELVNPDREPERKGTETYFNRESGFKTVLEQKLKTSK